MLVVVLVLFVLLVVDEVLVSLLVSLVPWLFVVLVPVLALPVSVVAPLSDDEPLLSFGVDELSFVVWASRSVDIGVVPVVDALCRPRVQSVA